MTMHKSETFPVSSGLIDMFTSGFYLQWCILALWKIADYKAARGQANTPYMVSMCM
jgi:hypothetical protein